MSWVQILGLMGIACFFYAVWLVERIYKMLKDIHSITTKDYYRRLHDEMERQSDYGP